jgi:hypothetical protein
VTIKPQNRLKILAGFAADARDLTYSISLYYLCFRRGVYRVGPRDCQRLSWVYVHAPHATDTTGNNLLKGLRLCGQGRPQSNRGIFWLLPQSSRAGGIYKVKSASRRPTRGIGLGL